MPYPIYPTLKIRVRLHGSYLLLTKLTSLTFSILSASSSTGLDIRIEPLIEFGAANRHLDGVERIFHDEISVQLVHSPYDNVDIWLSRLRE